MSNRYIETPTVLGLLTKLGEHRLNGNTLTVENPDASMREFVPALRMVDGITDTVMDRSGPNPIIRVETDSGLTLEDLYLRDLLNIAPEPAPELPKIETMGDVAQRATDRSWTKIGNSAPRRGWGRRVLLDQPSGISISENPVGYLRIEVDGVHYDTLSCGPGQDALLPFVPGVSNPYIETDVPGLTVQPLASSNYLRIRRASPQD